MWIHLTPALLRTHLADSEILALETAATTADVENILNEEVHNVAEAWRGRLKKGHAVDKRIDYVPSELLHFILIHVRYASFTRLPNMETLLDKLRQKEWDRANEIFDNPGRIAIEDPEEEYIDDPTPALMFVDPRNYKLDTYD